MWRCTVWSFMLEHCNSYSDGFWVVFYAVHGHGWDVRRTEKKLEKPHCPWIVVFFIVVQSVCVGICVCADEEKLEWWERLFFPSSKSWHSVCAMLSVGECFFDVVSMRDVHISCWFHTHIARVGARILKNSGKMLSLAILRDYSDVLE